jgi:hypothetical protein
MGWLFVGARSNSPRNAGAPAKRHKHRLQLEHLEERLLLDSPFELLAGTLIYNMTAFAMPPTRLTANPIVEIEPRSAPSNAVNANVDKISSPSVSWNIVNVDLVFASLSTSSHEFREGIASPTKTH